MSGLGLVRLLFQRVLVREYYGIVVDTVELFFSDYGVCTLVGYAVVYMYVVCIELRCVR